MIYHQGKGIYFPNKVILNESFTELGSDIVQEVITVYGNKDRVRDIVNSKLSCGWKIAGFKHVERSKKSLKAHSIVEVEKNA